MKMRDYFSDILVLLVLIMFVFLGVWIYTRDATILDLVKGLNGAILALATRTMMGAKNGNNGNSTNGLVTGTGVSPPK